MARSRAKVRCLDLATCLLLSGTTLTLAQETMASNSSADFPPTTQLARYILNGTEFVDGSSTSLSPLTTVAASPSPVKFQNFNTTGKFLNVNPYNVNNIPSGCIAYISCDDSEYNGQNLKASNVINYAANGNNAASAIILYTVEGHHCNYTASNGFAYSQIYTTLDPSVAEAIAKLNLTTSSPGSATIGPDVSSYSTGSPIGPPGSNTSSSSSNNTQSNNIMGPSPTTAVAMTILYAITGLITAIFICIIAAGAIRAHRHPERYGPRNIPGRPRQSRAKGMARAMLENLPIVKFGDHEEPPSKDPGTGGDIEMQAPASADQAPKDTNNHKSATTEVKTEAGESAGDEEATASAPSEVAGAAGAASAASEANGTQTDSTLGCSICTEDFTRGEELRVLPCKHKFHPDCVDPWLLNISGTCPLCRIDLRPTTSATETEAVQDGANNNTDLPPPLETDPDAPGPLAGAADGRGNTISEIAFPAHASRADRIAALRRLRSQWGAGNRARTEAERRGLSSRLRDRFRIRTTQADEQQQSQQGQGPRAETSRRRSVLSSVFVGLVPEGRLRGGSTPNY